MTRIFIHKIILVLCCCFAATNLFSQEEWLEAGVIEMEVKSETVLTGVVKVHGYKLLPEDTRIIIAKEGEANTPFTLQPRRSDGYFRTTLQPQTQYIITYLADSFMNKEVLHTPATYYELNKNVILNFSKAKDYPFTKTVLNKKRIDKLKTEIERLKEERGSEWNFKNQATLVRFKLEESFLALIDPENWDVEYENKLDELESKVKELSALNIIPYQEFFDYNITTINTSTPDFTDFISTIVKEKPTDKIYVSIETASSKVPTRNQSNKELAKQRAKNAQQKMIDALTEKGIKKENIVFDPLEYSVKGPAYNREHHNQEVYKKHQYVRITVR